MKTLLNENYRINITSRQVKNKLKLEEGMTLPTPIPSPSLLYRQDKMRGSFEAHNNVNTFT